MSLPWWDSTPNAPTQLDGTAWDYITIGNMELPGVLEDLPKAEPGRKVDKKNGPGIDGATLTWHGYEPPEVTIKLLLWTEDHWAEWQRILPVLLPRPGKPPATPFAIDHPMLAAYGITEVAILKTPTLEKSGRPGVMRATIVAQQWVKPKKTGTSTPKKVTAGVPATVHDQKGGYTPTAAGPPTPPQPPSKFNVDPT